jgi:cell division protein ZapA (FtsZ GTPase activity inhibitor)
VTIAGQRYTLRSDASEEYVRRLASLVEERLRHNLSQSRRHSTQAIAVLTALQLADAWQREAERRRTLRTDVRRSLRALRALLGSGGSGGSSKPAEKES